MSPAPSPLAPANVQEKLQALKGPLDKLMFKAIVSNKLKISISFGFKHLVRYFLKIIIELVNNRKRLVELHVKYSTSQQCPSSHEILTCQIFPKKCSDQLLLE